MILERCSEFPKGRYVREKRLEICSARWKFVSLTIHERRSYSAEKDDAMEEKILKALEEKGAMRPGEIAAAVGVEKAEVDKVIKKLAKEEKIFSPKRCYYDLKK